MRPRLAVLLVLAAAAGAPVPPGLDGVFRLALGGGDASARTAIIESDEWAALRDERSLVLALDTGGEPAISPEGELKKKLQAAGYLH